MVARLVEKKGVEVALDAMRRLRDRGCEVELRIVGDGPERTRIESLRESADSLRVLVRDGSPLLPHVNHAQPEDESGRGLFLVDALTSRWGIHEGTTHVWFEVEARSAVRGRPGPRLGQDERPEALD